MIHKAAPFIAMALCLIALVASASAVDHGIIPPGERAVRSAPRTQLTDILFVVPVQASETTQVNLQYSKK